MRATKLTEQAEANLKKRKQKQETKKGAKNKSSENRKLGEHRQEFRSIRADNTSSNAETGTKQMN